MNNHLILSPDNLTENPFKHLLLSTLPVNLSLSEKVTFLKEFSVALHHLEAQAEKNLTRNFAATILGGLSAAFTISGAGTLIPIVGWTISGIAVSAAIASIGKSIEIKVKVTPILESLKAHRVSLDSQEALQWAVLWELVGVDLFCQSISYASRPVMFRCSDSPFMRAVDFIAECQGVSYEQVITNAKTLKSSHKPPVGQTTKLRAVEVPSSRLVDAIPSTQATKPVEALREAPQQPQSIDIALEMARIPKSTIIAASPRVGKGVVVSQAIAHLQSLHPDLEIWLLDPKAEPTESGYWGVIDPLKRCHCDIRDFNADVEDAVEVFSGLLQRFNTSRSEQKLLIIDEFVSLSQVCKGSFLNKLKNFIVSTCSSGEVNENRGQGRFIWLITQSPYVSDLGFNTKAATSVFERVLLVSKQTTQICDLAVNADYLPPKTEERMQQALRETGRAFYHTRLGKWHPIPIYQIPQVAAIQETPSGDIEKLEKIFQAPNAEVAEVKDTAVDLTTEEGRIGFLVALVEEFLKEKNIDYSEVASVYNGKNRAKKVGNLPEFKALIRAATAKEKLTYFSVDKKWYVGFYDCEKAWEQGD